MSPTPPGSQHRAQLLSSPVGASERAPSRSINVSDLATAGLIYTPPPLANALMPLPFLVAGRSVLLRPWDAPRVLILGYGLGAMAAVALRARPDAALIGVEPDAARCAEARRCARRTCGALPGTVIRCEGAIAYLRRTRRRFDLVIDDCFEEPVAGDTRRPRELCEHAALVRSRLTVDGIYLRNLLPESLGTATREPSIAEQWRDVREVFRWQRLRRFREWDNVLVIASDRPVDADAWRLLSTG